MKKILTIGLMLVLVFSTLALTACGDSSDSDSSDSSESADLTDWEYIEDNGVLVVGLDDTFAPMGFRDKDDNLVGFDIDLANAVGEELGIDIKFQPISWDAKDLELKNKNIDCIWNGMSATPERQEAMSLSNKYINNKIVLMKLADSNVTIDNAADMEKYTIGTQSDSSGLEMLNALDNIDNIKVSEYKTYDQAILDLKAGRVDAIAVDQVLGEYKNANMDGIMEECTFDLGDDFYAIGFRKDDTELTSKVNDALEATIENGKAVAISNQWFGKNIMTFEGYDD